MSPKSCEMLLVMAAAEAEGVSGGDSEDGGEAIICGGEWGDIWRGRGE